jgi:hypothetical protein
MSFFVGVNNTYIKPNELTVYYIHNGVFSSLIDNIINLHKFEHFVNISKCFKLNLPYIIFLLHPFVIFIFIPFSASVILHIVVLEHDSPTQVNVIFLFVHFISTNSAIWLISLHVL